MIASAKRARSPAAKSAPRHKEIAHALRLAIRRGEHPIGSQLPTEETLAAQFGASRPTVRNALAALAQEGLIVRRPRVGSTVVATQQSAVLTQQVHSVEELMGYPAYTYREALSSAYVKADPSVAATLRCPPGMDWFLISMLRYAGDSPVPLCWTDMYVLPPYAGVTRHSRHLEIPVCNQIEEMFDISIDGASLEVYAGGVPAHMADALQAEESSPALFIVRRYHDADGVVFEVSISVHPERRYRMNFELRRELRPPRRGP